MTLSSSEYTEWYKIIIRIIVCYRAILLHNYVNSSTLSRIAFLIYSEQFTCTVVIQIANTSRQAIPDKYTIQCHSNATSHWHDTSSWLYCSINTKIVKAANDTHLRLFMEYQLLNRLWLATANCVLQWRPHCHFTRLSDWDAMCSVFSYCDTV